MRLWLANSWHIFPSDIIQTQTHAFRFNLVKFIDNTPRHSVYGHGHGGHRQIRIWSVIPGVSTGLGMTLMWIWTFKRYNIMVQWRPLCRACIEKSTHWFTKLERAQERLLLRTREGIDLGSAGMNWLDLARGYCWRPRDSRSWSSIATSKRFTQIVLIVVIHLCTLSTKHPTTFFTALTITITLDNGGHTQL